MFKKDKRHIANVSSVQNSDFDAGMLLGGGTVPIHQQAPVQKSAKELIKQFTSIAADAETQFRYCYENGQKVTAKACYRIMNAARTVIPMLSLSESAEAITQAMKLLKEMDTNTGLVSLGETIERIIEALSDQTPVMTSHEEDSAIQHEMDAYAALLVERDASKRL